MGVKDYTLWWKSNNNILTLGISSLQPSLGFPGDQPGPLNRKLSFPLMPL